MPGSIKLKCSMKKYPQGLILRLLGLMGSALAKVAIARLNQKWVKPKNGEHIIENRVLSKMTKKRSELYIVSNVFGCIFMVCIPFSCVSVMVDDFHPILNVLIWNLSILNVFVLPILKPEITFLNF